MIFVGCQYHDIQCTVRFLPSLCDLWWRKLRGNFCSDTCRLCAIPHHTAISSVWSLRESKWIWNSEIQVGNYSVYKGVCGVHRRSRGRTQTPTLNLWWPGSTSSLISPPTFGAPKCTWVRYSDLLRLAPAQPHTQEYYQQLEKDYWQ